MKYGVVFRIDLYDFEKEEAVEVVTTPGDYLRMTDWVKANLDESDGTAGELRTNYAIVWFALRRRGELDKFGLPGELSDAALLDMADRFSVYVNSVEDDTLPLAR